MGSFSDRLKLQKIIYLVQQSGIELGFNYSWYIYGPYCPELTKIGYNIEKFGSIKPVALTTQKYEKKLEQLIVKIGDKKNDDFWLEVSTSIHALKEIYTNESKNSIITKIQSKRTEFYGKESQIRQVWDDIEGWFI